MLAIATHVRHQRRQLDHSWVIRMNFRMRFGHSDCRHGFTLIEMILAISVMSVVMALSGMTFHLLLRSEKLVTRSFVTERLISKLSTDFRSDIHLAKSASTPMSVEPARGQLELDFGDGTHARYEIEKNRITRFLVKNEVVTAREDYRLPDCQIRLIPGTDGQPSLRRLIIDRPGPTMTRHSQAPRPLRSLMIEAYLNRWHPPQTKVESQSDGDASSDNNGAQE